MLAVRLWSSIIDRPDKQPVLVNAMTQRRFEAARAERARHHVRGVRRGGL